MSVKSYTLGEKDLLRIISLVRVLSEDYNWDEGDEAILEKVIESLDSTSMSWEHSMYIADTFVDDADGW